MSFITRTFIAALLVTFAFAQRAGAQVAPFGSIGYLRTKSGLQGFVMETKFGRFTHLRDSFTVSNQFTQNSLELRLPIRKAPLAMGNRAYGIRGWSFYPQFSIGGIRKSGIGNNFSGSSWGIVSSPGINITFPYIIFEANIQSAYYFNPDANGKKLFFTPTIGIKLDGLFEVLDASVTSGGKHSGWETTKTGESRERRVGYDVITSHYKSEYKTHEYLYYSVSNFGGITPRYTWAKPTFAGETKMFGVSYNQRISNMAIDVVFETGQQGYASHPKERSYLYNPFPDDNGVNEVSTTFIAQGNQTRAYMRVGVDLKDVITRLILRTRSSNKSVAAFRVIGGIGVGYAKVSNTRFLNSEANAKMDQLLEDNRDLWRSGMNDARLTKSGLMYHGFIAFEFGVVVVELNRSIIRNAPMSAGGLNTSVSYIIPIAKLAQKYKATN